MSTHENMGQSNAIKEGLDQCQSEIKRLRELLRSVGDAIEECARALDSLKGGE